MARTKQTARKSTGGKAPRKVLASKCARAFRQELTSRQAADWEPQSKKVSYLNYDNMLNSYLFKADKEALKSEQPLDAADKGKDNAVDQEKEFAAQFAAATTLTLRGPGGVFVPLPEVAAGTKLPDNVVKERWLSMQLMSKYDGDGLALYGRPRVNLAIALDVSGSMSCSFDSEEEDFDPDMPAELRMKKIPRSKISVARDCLVGLVDYLTENDSFGVVTFDSVAREIAPLKKFTPSIPKQGDFHDKNKIKEDIKALRANGMTSLSSGMNLASRLFDKAPECAERTTNRIYFLTDLNSTLDSKNDELQLLQQVQENSRKGVYTTVVGFGTDMNQTLVRQLSAIVGCKYCSVDNSDEFVSMLKLDFGYEITMTATDISVEVKSKDWRLATKGYGSPEVSENKEGKVFISCEFAQSRNENWESKGGIFLFKLEETKKEMPPLELQLSYRDTHGFRHEETHVLQVPDQHAYQTSAIRKAIAIIRYVDLHNQYIEFDDEAPQALGKRTRGSQRVNFFEVFSEFKRFYLDEMKQVDDNSISTYNEGDIQILDKIIELEKQELANRISTAPSSNIKKEKSEEKKAKVTKKPQPKNRSGSGTRRSTRNTNNKK